MSIRMSIIDPTIMLNFGKNFIKLMAKDLCSVQPTKSDIFSNYYYDKETKTITKTMTFGVEQEQEFFKEEEFNL